MENRVFGIGDLVSLEGDKLFQAGLGLVIDIKIGSEDFLDLIYFLESNRDKDFAEKDLHKQLSEPHFLIVWISGKRKRHFYHLSNELSLVAAARR